MPPMSAHDDLAWRMRLVFLTSSYLAQELKHSKFSGILNIQMFFGPFRIPNFEFGKTRFMSKGPLIPQGPAKI